MLGQRCTHVILMFGVCRDDNYINPLSAIRVYSRFTLSVGPSKELKKK